ncbi:MAG: N-acetylneuraminate synthase family protein [Acidimicrobiales bacterium]
MTLDFGGRLVGDGQPCYVIAEAGANHNRSFETAIELIDAAADAKADAIKFQTYSGASLYSTKAPKFEYLGDLAAEAPHELLERISLPREWQAQLAAHAAKRGIHFMSSPFDRQAVDELDALDVPALKIASFELVDLGFIEYVGATKRPVILSTGMASLGEIEEAIAACRRGGTDQIALLQCASLYPSPPHIMNLRTIAAMSAAFGVPVGLSDHTLGTHISSASIAAGASIIEKHFTLDRSMPGPDHPFAIEPDELTTLVQHVRDVEAAMGSSVKRGPSAEEAEEMYSKARRSIVAATDLPAGTVIAQEHLCVKRPGFGIAPKFMEAVIGRVVPRDIEADEIITWDHL